ncbi:putative SWEET sugar transporter [Helianthus annuus]|nr:putative SWEET sugar transporter [Helianthus annuus]
MFVCPCRKHHLYTHLYFSHIVKRKSAENYNGTPYVATLLSCSLWILYGLLDPDDGLLIVTVNTAGATMQALYLVLLLIYTTKEKRVQYFGFVILDIVFFGIVLAFTLVAFKESSRRTFTGVLCATFTTIMYVAPLAALRTTIRTKSVEYMPILLVSSLFLNGCVWLTFALLVTDIFVLVPNALGILLGTIQFLVYLKFKNSTPEAGELGKDYYEKQIETSVIDIQDSNVISNNVSTQNRTLTRLDAFPVIRSPSLSPNRSPSNQQHEDDTEQWCELKV